MGARRTRWMGGLLLAALFASCSGSGEKSDLERYLGQRPAKLEDDPEVAKCVATVAEDRRKRSRVIQPCSAKKIPEDLKGGYLMSKAGHKGKKVVQGSYFRCDVKPEGKIRKAYTVERVQKQMDKIHAKKPGYYPSTDKALFHLLQKHGNLWKGRSVAVMGSQKPYYEAMGHVYGAGNVTTVEYQKFGVEVDWLRVLTVMEYERKPEQFDVGMSISSFEHDGLGRYGDPLAPDGDLLAMDNMKCLVRKGGLMVLAVPTHPDAVVWNAHREYGKMRLPLLIKRWKLLEIVTKEVGNRSFKECMDGGQGRHCQPIYILANEGGLDADHSEHNQKFLEATMMKKRR